MAVGPALTVARPGRQKLPGRLAGASRVVASRLIGQQRLKPARHVPVEAVHVQPAEHPGHTSHQPAPGTPLPADAHRPPETMRALLDRSYFGLEQVDVRVDQARTAGAGSGSRCGVNVQVKTVFRPPRRECLVEPSLQTPPKKRVYVTSFRERPTLTRPCRSYIGPSRRPSRMAAASCRLACAAFPSPSSPDGSRGCSATQRGWAGTRPSRPRPARGRYDHPRCGQHGQANPRPWPSRPARRAS